MSIPFSAVITPLSIIFNSPAGKMINISSGHSNYDAIKSTLKELQVAIRDNPTSAQTGALHNQLTELAEPARAVQLAGQGHNVTVVDGIVCYLGTPINNSVTKRILWGLSEGYDMQPYVHFLNNLMDNPSKRAVDELYGFIENCEMGITDDGFIIAYKRVRGDYKDCHTGTFDNSVGQILDMPRNQVNDDSSALCSDGFHFCSFSYLPHFGASSGNRVVIVKVNPADVVSIPKDYKDAKARTCRYEVIGEYEGADLQDILSTKAVWAISDWSKKEDGVETEEDDDAEDDDTCSGCGNAWGYCVCDVCSICEKDYAYCTCDDEAEDEAEAEDEDEDEDEDDSDNNPCPVSGSSIITLAQTVSSNNIAYITQQFEHGGRVKEVIFEFDHLNRFLRATVMLLSDVGIIIEQHDLLRLNTILASYPEIQVVTRIAN